MLIRAYDGVPPTMTLLPESLAITPIRRKKNKDKYTIFNVLFVITAILVSERPPRPPFATGQKYPFG